MKTHRLYFLDWVRILAFFLLIAYHTGMYYVTWDWHVKSPFASSAIEPFMTLSSPWRLGLLFMIAGVASHFLFEKLQRSRFLAKRSWRLLVPLIFGMFVVVPPQPYLEVVEKVAYSGSYFDFMKLYVKAYPGFCRDTDCLDLPTWNHLWFVAYLWVYTMLFGLIAGQRLARWADAVGARLHGWRMLVLPWIGLTLLRIVLLTAFPVTHDLVNDWYNHAHNLFLFGLGALLASQREAWPTMDQLRWPALSIALSAWAMTIVYYSLAEHADGPWIELARPVMRGVYAACAWGAIVAACGFAHRHLNFDSAKRRYLTEAVFPVYIAHQTLIVVIAHALKPAQIAPVTEGLIVMVLSFAGSFGVFEIVKRIPLLRPCFGLETSRAKPEGLAPSGLGQDQAHVDVAARGV